MGKVKAVFYLSGGTIVESVPCGIAMTEEEFIKDTFEKISAYKDSFVVFRNVYVRVSEIKAIEFIEVCDENF